MQSLEKNGTWEIVSLPEKKKSVRCKWVFKRNEGLSPSEPLKFKARLVAKGFSQIPGVDYNDVFSPVVKHSSIRTFFSIVAMHDLELEQLDVKTAFLHGELEEKKIHGSARWIRSARQGELCLQIEEVLVWFEAVPSSMV